MSSFARVLFCTLMIIGFSTVDHPGFAVEVV